MENSKNGSWASPFNKFSTLSAKNGLSGDDDKRHTCIQAQEKGLSASLLTYT